MLFKIYALENTPARLCAGYTTTTDPVIKDLVVERYEGLGMIANVEVEE